MSAPVSNRYDALRVHRKTHPPRPLTSRERMMLAIYINSAGQSWPITACDLGLICNLRERTISELTRILRQKGYLETRLLHDPETNLTLCNTYRLTPEGYQYVLNLMSRLVEVDGHRAPIRRMRILPHIYEAEEDASGTDASREQPTMTTSS